MDFDPSWISDDAWNHLLKMAASFGMARAGVLILVAARLAGVLLVGPLLGRTVLTWPVRFGLIVLLTAVVTPQLPSDGLNADPVDVASHAIEPDALPTALTNSWTAHPHWLPGNFLMAVICDAGIGVSIGLCVAVFLSGLKLGGEWFDRHSGLGMGSILNPEFSSGGAGPAEMVAMFSVASLLVLQPINGHLLAVRLILDTFVALPVGSATIPVSVIELPSAIVQQSLILGLRIAVPFVVAMSLLDLTLGFAHRSSRWQLAPTAFVIRAAASLLILAATFPGIQEAAASSLMDALQTNGEAIQTTKADSS